MAKGPQFYKNLARQIAQQEFPGDRRSQSIYMNQIRQESAFNPGARSGAGAQGIAQFMPSTAASMHINPNNPAQALHAAARMDKANLRKYGNWSDTLSLYNSGRGWKQGQKIGETNNYVQTILGHAQQGAPMAQAIAQAGPPPAHIGSGGSRQKLVQALLSSNAEFVRTGQVGALDPLALQQDTTNAHADAMKAVGGAMNRMNPRRANAQAVTGMDPQFKERLNAMIAASGGRLKINSGFRSSQEQAVLFKNAVKKYGSVAAARKWVAPPGHSNHNKGIAADLGGDLNWAHANAARFGLHFPMSWEAWHIEPIGSR